MEKVHEFKAGDRIWGLHYIGLTPIVESTIVKRVNAATLNLDDALPCFDRSFLVNKHDPRIMLTEKEAHESVVQAMDRQIRRQESCLSVLRSTMAISVDKLVAIEFNEEED